MGVGNGVGVDFVEWVGGWLGWEWEWEWLLELELGVGVEMLWLWLRARVSDLGCGDWWVGMGGSVVGRGMSIVGSGSIVLGSLVVSYRSKSRLNMGDPNDP